MRDVSMFRWSSRRLAALGVVAMLLMGCASENTARPVPGDPNRGALRDPVRTIEQAVRAEGFVPVGGRDVQLKTGKTIYVEVTVEGHAFGIAYVDDEDVKTLGDAIPPYKPGEPLHIVRGGPDDETRILLLYQRRYDVNLHMAMKGLNYGDTNPGLAFGVMDAFKSGTADDVARQRTQNSEQAMATDVQMFLDHARKKGYK